MPHWLKIATNDFCVTAGKSWEFVVGVLCPVNGYGHLKAKVMGVCCWCFMSGQWVRSPQGKSHGSLLLVFYVRSMSTVTSRQKSWERQSVGLFDI